jgi:hypothetical protein
MPTLPHAFHIEARAENWLALQLMRLGGRERLEWNRMLRAVHPILYTTYHNCIWSMNGIYGHALPRTVMNTSAMQEQTRRGAREERTRQLCRGKKGGRARQTLPGTQ